MKKGNKYIIGPKHKEPPFMVNLYLFSFFKGIYIYFLEMIKCYVQSVIGLHAKAHVEVE
jgi:hypothetical protein